MRGDLHGSRAKPGMTIEGEADVAASQNVIHAEAEA